MGRRASSVAVSAGSVCAMTAVPCARARASRSERVVFMAGGAEDGGDLKAGRAEVATKGTEGAKVGSSGFCVFRDLCGQFRRGGCWRGGSRRIVLFLHSLYLSRYRVRAAAGRKRRIRRKEKDDGGYGWGAGAGV